ncbi:MAG: hypothetical protein ACYCVH_12755 [Ignavibacteriaceae bacterium]
MLPIWVVAIQTVSDVWANVLNGAAKRIIITKTDITVNIDFMIIFLRIFANQQLFVPRVEQNN